MVPITDQSSWFIQFAVCSISFDRVLNIVWAAGLSNAKRPCCRFDRHTVGFQILTFRDCFSDQSPGLEERASERERERERETKLLTFVDPRQSKPSSGTQRKKFHELYRYIYIYIHIYIYIYISKITSYHFAIMLHA